MRRSRASPRPGRRVCRLTACRRYRPGLRLLSSWPPAAGMENGNRSALAGLDAGLGARSWSRCWSGAGASRRRGRFAITRLGGRRSWSTDDGTTWLAAAGPPGVDAVARVFQKIERSLQGDLRAHGLNGAQFDVLAQTGSAEGLGKQELADRLLVTNGDVSQPLAKMERRGIVRRCPIGRAHGVYMTEGGGSTRKSCRPTRTLSPSSLPSCRRRSGRTFSRCSASWTTRYATPHVRGLDTATVWRAGSASPRHLPPPRTDGCRHKIVRGMLGVGARRSSACDVSVLRGREGEQHVRVAGGPMIWWR